MYRFDSPFVNAHKAEKNIPMEKVIFSHALQTANGQFNFSETFYF